MSDPSSPLNFGGSVSMLSDIFTIPDMMERDDPKFDLLSTLDSDLNEVELPKEHESYPSSSLIKCNLLSSFSFSLYSS